MAFLDDVGSGVNNGVKAFNDFSRDLGGAIFGNGQDPGALGTGQYQVNRYTPDESAAQMPRYEQWQQRLDAAAGAAGQRQAPNMQAAQLGPAAMYGGATINQGPQAQFRNGQSQLVSQLQAQAVGQGPSLAQGQLKQATDRNMAQALSLAAASNPYGDGAGMRNLAAQRAAMGQQAASDSSQLRLQEQLQAQNQLGQVLAGARGQDIGLATEQAGLQQQAGLSNQNARNQFALQQAGFNQQTGLANQSAALQQQQMNDQLTQFYTQSGLSLDEAQRQAAMAMQQMKLNGQLGFEGIQSGAYGNAAQNRQQMFQTLLQAGTNGAQSAGQGISTLAMLGLI